MADRGRLVVISGPSGSGKTTICDTLKDEPGFARSVSATTRAPRTGEKDGVDYYFLTREEFEEMAARGGLLEHAEVFGNLYGTPREKVEAAVAGGDDVLLNIDVQGAGQLRETWPDGVFVFIMPPDQETLRKRLAARGTETDEQIRRRIAAAEAEMSQRDLYDHVVVNDRLDDALREVRTILGRENG